MLGWAIIFFLLGVVSGVLGFGGLAGAFTWAAELLFFACVILFVLSLVSNFMSANRTKPPL